MSNGVAEGKSPLCYLTQLRNLHLLPLFYVTSCHVVHKYSKNVHKMKSSLPINNIFLHFFKMSATFLTTHWSQGEIIVISLCPLGILLTFALLFFDKSEQIYAKFVSPSNYHSICTYLSLEQHWRISRSLSFVQQSLSEILAVRSRQLQLCSPHFAHHRSHQIPCCFHL